MIALLDSWKTTALEPKARTWGGRVMEHDAPSFYHEPVLLAEVLRCLAPASDRVIVDCTLGGGGHSEALLQAGARVIGMDQDPQAVEFASRRLERFGAQFTAVRANFTDVATALDALGIVQIHGALLDLGVSSWQLDSAERGFSFAREGALDMRMNPDSPLTAADLVNDADADELVRIFRELGEEPAARRIAAAIVRARAERPFVTTLDLARCVEKEIPRHGRTHPATRVFQSLRLAVNRELDVIEPALTALAARLAPGGKLAVISFHSLEDRIVKNFFKHRSQAWLDRPEWPEPRRNPDCIFHALTRKPLVATESEQTRNPRSRSAKLRAVEKI